MVSDTTALGQMPDAFPSRPSVPGNSFAGPVDRYTVIMLR